MARYPRYCVGADAARSSSSRVLYKVNTTVDVEQTFEGGAPDECQPPSTVSSSQLVEGHPESTDYQALQEPSATELSFPKKEKEQLKDRVRRLLEKEDRFFRELRRDCFLIALVLILLVVLILWFASGGFFNGPKPRPVPPKGGPLKIIMDVDTGVDDAMALILALTSERATVEAITIVAGNAYRDAAYNNTLRVLNLLGRTDMPVFKGADRPIAQQLVTEKFYFGPDSFGGVSDKYPMAVLKSVSNKVAPVVMRNMIRQRPKELTLLMIGPLTNLAIAMLMDPELTDDVEQIFIMGGNIYGQGNVRVGGEFNFVTDPEAARVVLQRSTCPVTVVVWEALLQGTVPWDVYNEVVAQDTKLAKFLHDVNNHTIECCMKHQSPSGFRVGDFLAVMAALVPGSVSGSLDVPSDVELNGDYTRGQMVMVHAWLKGQLPHITRSVTIVHSFDIEAVSNQFRKVFMAEDSDDE
ncbi:hypothetical protein MRX96_046184 [Rhipicephalus microplus]